LRDTNTQYFSGENIMAFLQQSRHFLIPIFSGALLLLSTSSHAASATATATSTSTVAIEASKSTAASSKPKITLKTKKSSSKKSTALPITETAASDDDEKEPDVLQSRVSEYKCELGNSLTMYSNNDDDNHLAMRWKKRIYRLTRVETSTGAHRFENRKAGFVWIGIPTKALLLDSIRGHQLANECKTAESQVADAQNSNETAVKTK